MPQRGPQGPKIVLAKDGWKAFSESHTATRAGFGHVELPSTAVQQCERIQLNNGDLAHRGGWVLYSSPREGPHTVLSATRCGRVEEILLRGSNGELLGVLLAEGEVGSAAEKPYRLPSVKDTSPRRWDFVSLEVSPGTLPAGFIAHLLNRLRRTCTALSTSFITVPRTPANSQRPNQ